MTDFERLVLLCQDFKITHIIVHYADIYDKALKARKHHYKPLKNNKIKTIEMTQGEIITKFFFEDGKFTGQEMKCEEEHGHDYFCSCDCEN